MTQGDGDYLLEEFHDAGMLLPEEIAIKQAQARIDERVRKSHSKEAARLSNLFNNPQQQSGAAQVLSNDKRWAQQACASQRHGEPVGAGLATLLGGVGGYAGAAGLRAFGMLPR